MITVFEQIVLDAVSCKGGTSCQFYQWDNGDAYTQVINTHKNDLAEGSIVVLEGLGVDDVESIGQPDDQLRIAVFPKTTEEHIGTELKLGDQVWSVQGLVREKDGWHARRVQVIPLQEHLFSRTSGLFETDVLAEAGVLVAGLGSGGSPICLELAKLGVSLALLDHDRIEVANVVRHVAGISDVGRLKVNVLSGMVLEKNPYAGVETHPVKITRDSIDMLRELIRKSDLSICAVDDHDARVIFNRTCVEEKKPYIMAATFRRAYGGQILFVKPGETPCYQCFQMALPEMVRDREVSSPEQAQRHAYSDRPVAIEPGLSNDISPICQLVVKLAIQYLLQGTSTTFQSLDEDLVAPWYLWLNRREAGTDYEQLTPLEYELDGMHILRWYGIDIPRNDRCPCCGNFVRALCETENTSLDEDAISAFGISEGDS